MSKRIELMKFHILRLSRQFVNQQLAGLKPVSDCKLFKSHRHTKSGEWPSLLVMTPFPTYIPIPLPSLPYTHLSTRSLLWQIRQIIDPVYDNAWPPVAEPATAPVEAVEAAAAAAAVAVFISECTEPQHEGRIGGGWLESDAGAPVVWLKVSIDPSRY